MTAWKQLTDNQNDDENKHQGTMMRNPAPTPSPVSHCSRVDHGTTLNNDNEHQHPIGASMMGSMSMTTEHDLGPSVPAWPPYDNDRHQHQPDTNDKQPSTPQGQGETEMRQWGLQQQEPLQLQRQDYAQGPCNQQCTQGHSTTQHHCQHCVQGG